jgi:hypothetical protein
MANCSVSNILERGHASPHLLDVNRGRLLLVVGSKVLSRMSIAMERPALDGTVLKDAGCDGSGGACTVASHQQRQPGLIGRDEGLTHHHQQQSRSRSHRPKPH